MILIIDNYDSFTFNLVQMLGSLSADIRVERNDMFHPDDIRKWHVSGIVISPGPGRPESAGCVLNVIQEYAGKIPILGVCLGHQAIGVAFGGKVVQAPTLMHGRTSAIHHDGKGLFVGMPNPFMATRYHSLVISNEVVPEDLEVTARTHEGVIMGVRNSQRLIEGVQFHPESIMTEQGSHILENWLRGQ